MSTVGELLDAAAWATLHERARRDGFPPADRAAILTRLAAVAATLAPEDRDEVLILAGEVALDAPGATHADPLATLRALTGDWLATPTDANGFVRRLRAVLALEGDRLWGDELEILLHDEVEIECPHCETELMVAFGRAGRFTTDASRAAREPLRPAGPAELTGVGLRLYALAVEAGQAETAAAVTYLFGSAICTRCGTTFRPSDQVEDY